MLWGQIPFIDSPEMTALCESYRAEGFGIYWRIVQHIGLRFDPRRDERPAQTLTAQRWGQICGCSATRFLSVAALAAKVSLICMHTAGAVQPGRRTRRANAEQLYEIEAPILLQMLGATHQKAPKIPNKDRDRDRDRDIYRDGEKHKESAAKAADKKVAPEAPADAEAPARTEQFSVAEETPEPPAKNAGGESFLTPPGMAIIPFTPREDRRDALGWFRAVFWTQWPVKQNRQAAEKEALKIKPEDRGAVMAGIQRQSAQIAEMERPIHASTWLHQRRWEDAEHHVQRQLPMSATERAIQYGMDRVKRGLPL